MKLPWKSRPRTSEPAPDDHTVEDVPPSKPHRSPGLEAVLEGYPRGDVIRVLDLGPAIPENIDFLAGFANWIQVVDAMREAPDISQAIPHLRSLMPEHRSAFHLVLVWDCLNYLSPDQGAALIEAVSPLCRPDARCLSMVYASDTMPAAPGKYRVVDESHLMYEMATTEVMGSPQLTPAAVEHVLAGFSLEHAFVLRSGVREYVAIRDVAASKTKS